MKIDLTPSGPIKRSLKEHPFLWWFVFSIVVCIIFAPIGVLLSFVSFFFAVSVYSKKKAVDKEIKRMILVNEANKYIDSIKEAKAVPTISPQGSIFLDKDEHLFLKENVQMRETRSVRRSTGSFGSVRIVKGFSVGRYGGTSSSSLEWALLDNGSLFITDKKLCFTGSKENRTIQLKKIVAVETFLDAIQITIDGRSKAIQFPVRNPYIWSLVINIVKSAPDPLKLGDLELNVQLQ